MTIPALLDWPTWQEAWGATVVLVVLSGIVRRVRPTRLTETVLPGISELIFLTAIYGPCATARKLPLYQADGAMERARDIVELQDRLFLPAEIGLQEFLLRHDWLGWLSAAYYAGLHTPVTIVFLIWMFVRHRSAYRRWRTVLALTTAGCLVIRFWRVAPPRFLTDLGYQDLSEVYGLPVYGPIGTGVSQQFAAMPSIHVAWAGVVCFGAVAASRSPWRWVAAAHLPLTMLVVAGTGHHWWLDGIVSLGLMALAMVIDRVGRQWWSERAERLEAASAELAPV